MKHPASALALAGLCLAGLAAPAVAEIKLNDQFSVSGFLAGSYALDTPSPGKSSDHLDVDNGLLAFRGKSGPAGFVVSLYHEPGTPQETTLLDAALSYETPGGFTVTAGRFQSLLAYEAYFAVDNPNVAFANNELLTIAPGFHSGVKLEHGTDTWSVGAAVLDSVYSGSNYLKGDGELKNNQGFEAVFSFKAIKDLVITVDAGYEGATPAGGTHVHLYSADLARGPDGAWKVMASRADAPGGTLTIGEKKKLELARALATHESVMEAV